jgi:hypothetical protein
MEGVGQVGWVGSRALVGEMLISLRRVGGVESKSTEDSTGYTGRAMYECIVPVDSIFESAVCSTHSGSSGLRPEDLPGGVLVT